MYCAFHLQSLRAGHWIQINAVKEFKGVVRHSRSVGVQVQRVVESAEPEVVLQTATSDFVENSFAFFLRVQSKMLRVFDKMPLEVVQLSGFVGMIPPRVKSFPAKKYESFLTC